MKDDICAEMCVCLVRVESCPYKLCSVDLRFSAYLGFSFSVAASMAAVVLGCRITRSVLLVLTYLVSFGLFFFVLFSFCSVVLLLITALLPPATYRELNWQSWCTQ